MYAVWTHIYHLPQNCFQIATTKPVLYSLTRARSLSLSQSHKSPLIRLKWYHTSLWTRWDCVFWRVCAHMCRGSRCTLWKWCVRYSLIFGRWHHIEIASNYSGIFEPSKQHWQRPGCLAASQYIHIFLFISLPHSFTRAHHAANLIGALWHFGTLVVFSICSIKLGPNFQRCSEWICQSIPQNSIKAKTCGKTNKARHSFAFCDWIVAAMSDKFKSLTIAAKMSKDKV